MFIERAFKAKTDWWRYIVSILLIFLGWQVIGAIPLLVVAFLKAGDLETFSESTLHAFTDIGIDPNLYLLLLICTFAFGLLGLWFSIKYIHEQPFKDVTTTREKVDWSRIFFAFLMVISINLPLFILGYFLEPEAFVWNFDPIPFFLLCLISLLFLPLQTSFEEYLFRGYLMQGLGILAKNKWFPLIVTSVFFGLLHGMNPEVEKLGYIMMVFYIGTGFLLGIMTLMDEGMELALGFHAANNIFAAILVTTDWTAFQVPALFRDVSEPTAGLDIVGPVVILYPLYLFILSKKYGWKDWGGKLFGIVEKPVMLKPSEEV